MNQVGESGNQIYFFLLLFCLLFISVSCASPLCLFIPLHLFNLLVRRLFSIPEEVGFCGALEPALYVRCINVFEFERKDTSNKRGHVSVAWVLAFV